MTEFGNDILVDEASLMDEPTTSNNPSVSQVIGFATEYGILIQ